MGVGEAHTNEAHVLGTEACPWLENQGDLLFPDICSLNHEASYCPDLAPQGCSGFLDNLCSAWDLARGNQFTKHLSPS